MTERTSPDPENDLGALLEFFHVCPVGLVSFGDDGTVRMANPAAVSLLVPAVGPGALTNIVQALAAAWPELSDLVAVGSERARTARPSHRIAFERGEDTEWVSCALLRVESDHHMLVVTDITSDVAAEESIREREFRLRTLFDSIDEAYCIAEMIVDDDGEPVDYRFLEANPLFGVMTGLPEPVGRTALELVPDLEPYWVETYAKVGLEGETLRFEQGSDALGRWFDVFAMPVEPHGRFALVFKDISDRHEWERAIAESERFTRRVLDNLYAFVGVMTPDGTLIEANQAPLEAAGVDLEDVIGKKFWDTYWWSHSEEEQARVQDATRRAADGEAVRYDAEVRIRDDGRMWIDFQLAPLRDDTGAITHLVPSGLDLTARKEAEDQRTRVLAAERRARRNTELLLRNATQLAAATTVEELADSVISSLSEGLALDIVSLNLLHDAGLRIVSSPSVHDAVRRAGFDLDVYLRGGLGVDLPGPAAIAANSTIVLNSADEISSAFPTVTQTFDSGQARSLWSGPLRSARGEVLGALVVVASEKDWFDAEMLALLQGFAEQTGLAIERAHLFDRVVDAQRKEHDIAVSLQQALLPDRFVSHPALEFAADYRAGSEMLAVGGDWFDTFVWSDDLVGIVVGDVAGHDLAATASMGRMRAALSALAPLISPGPVSLLTALEHCASGPTGTDFMTVACVVIDTVTGRASYATAGHPPPLVVTPDGSTVWMNEANSTPVGVDPDVQREEGTVQLEPGSLIVLYTDGLIERPSEKITDGLNRLAEAASHLATAPVTSVPAKLIAELTGDRSTDDVVGLAVRWTPTPDISTK